MEEVLAKLNEQRRNLLQQSEFETKSLTDKLNDEERDITRKVQNVKKSNETGLNSLKARTMKIKADTDALCSKFKKEHQIGQRCKIFIAMKSAQKSIITIDEDASDVNANIYEHIDTVNVEPEVDEEKTGKWFCFQHLVSSGRARTASYYSEIKIKKTTITSLCFLSETTLLISDYNGKCIIVLQDIQINTNSFETIQMISYPWDISKIEKNKVAVTFPEEKVITLITFSETMSVTGTEDIKVEAECYGIASGNDKLIVSYRNPAMVQILDMSGNVLNIFNTNVDGQSLFKFPQFLALSPDKTIIYVSDFNKDTVTSMTIDGTVNAVHKDPQLDGPRQITVDRSGTVYVCGELSENVHQLSSDLTKVKIFLDNSHGMKPPEGVAYSSSYDRLYVGLYNTGTIKVFNVSLS